MPEKNKHMNPPVRTRLAPSPTGYMHLGNIWSFMLCWMAARHAGGKVVLRMEDIDPARSRPEYVQGIMDDFKWLGLDWDEGPDLGGPYAPYTQSERLDRYEEVLAALTEQGHTFPCYCTRKELRALASAPHAEDYGSAYPGVCLHLDDEEREAKAVGGRKPAIRLHSDLTKIPFKDVLHGDMELTWNECGGDFAVRRSDGVFAYQLAVVIDDMDQRINLVVRGDDILHCTPRQVALYGLLGASVPEFVHVPLVLDAEGERLAKRHRHYEIAKLREKGISPKAIVGYLAYRAGLQPECTPAFPERFVAGFAWGKLPRGAVVLEDDVEDVLLRMS